jgi:hypothetical protein
MMLRLYLDLGFLTVESCDHGTVKLGPNTVLNLPEKWAIIAESIEATSLSDEKLKQMFTPHVFVSNLEGIIASTRKCMMAVYRNYKHLREYDAQTHFILRQERDWCHENVKIRPEEYTPPSKYDEPCRRVHVVTDLLRL